MAAPVRVAAQKDYRLVFWNVENLFDTHDDTTKNDDAFTPTGTNHWNSQRYRTKVQHLCQALTALGERGDGRFDMPVVVGLAEVENARVLRELCRGTGLRRFGYDFVHFDSPDARGIDNALLYRKKAYRPFLCQAITMSDSSRGWLTRDLLLVEGTLTTGDTLMLLVCHLPSKRGGSNAERQRMYVAQRLRTVMDTLLAAHPTAATVVMGDFNSEPYELRGILTPEGDSSYRNLMGGAPPGTGSYLFQGHWSWLDQMLVSRTLLPGDSVGCLELLQEQGQRFEADFLMTESPQHLDRAPRRTFQGWHYLGGYSDHLPIYIDLQRRR